MSDGSMHIGEVAERIGLSIRTIRHYEDVGLITASGRTAGGFRLYTHADAGRLQIVKDMKPLGFSLEEMRQLFAVLDCLDDPQAPTELQDEAMQKLAIHRMTADTRFEALRHKLRIAESFAGQLRNRLAKHRTDDGS